MSRIERLTPEQAALIPIWHQRWLEIGMCEQPIDRVLARSAIERAYATINKPTPLIVFCDSPATSSLGVAVWPHLMAGLKKNASLRASLRASLGDSLPYTYFWGQHDSYWVSFYLFGAEIGVQYKADALDKLRIMEDLSKSCGWIYFYENVCFVSGRPKVHTIIEQRNGNPVHILHHTDKPAMSFADGYCLYVWRGVRIPERYYTQSADAKAILSESNAEVRRALMERYDEQKGKGRFIEDCGAKVIHSDVQPMPDGKGAINELLSIDLPEDPDGRMVALRVIDPSTGRRYVIRVHPELRPMLADGTFGKPQAMTVRNALASTHGMRGEEFILAQES
jgi:hypothetical protein